jgi:hypothetical protein
LKITKGDPRVAGPVHARSLFLRGFAARHTFLLATDLHRRPQVRHMPHHAKGYFRRTSGEKVGVNLGNPQDLYLHPSCALEVKEFKPLVG